MSGKQSLVSNPTDAPTYSPLSMKFDWYIDSIPAVSSEIDQMWADSNSQYLYVMGGTLRRMDINTNIVLPFAGSLHDDDGLNDDDGGQATSAKFGYGSGVFGNSMGEIYVFDSGDCSIRVIDCSTGIIKRFAGGNGCGFGGDSGPATAAQINEFGNLSGDDSGNLYFADGYNGRIRRVSSVGIMFTYAGGGSNSGENIAATSASFIQPFFMSTDTNGRLYISDRSGCKVYSVSTSGILTTIAGTGDAASTGDGGPAVLAAVDYPYGTWPSTDGYLYLSDYWGNRIRMVDTHSGLIVIVAGTGQFSNDGNGVKATAASIGNPMAIQGTSQGLVFLGSDSGLRVLSVSAPSVAPTINTYNTIAPSLVPTFDPGSSLHPTASDDDITDSQSASDASTSNDSGTADVVGGIVGGVGGLLLIVVLFFWYRWCQSRTKKVVCDEIRPKDLNVGDARVAPHDNVMYV